MKLKVRGCGCIGKIRDMIDSPEGEEIGCGEFGMSDGFITIPVKNVCGRHAVFFKAEAGYDGWAKSMLDGRCLFELKSFIFKK